MNQGNPLVDTILTIENEKGELLTKSEPLSEHKITSGYAAGLVKRMLSVVDGVGVGLAAIQIGFPDRIVVMDLGDGMKEYINPEIISRSPDIVYSQEGCLSVPGKRFVCKRNKELELSYTNLSNSKQTRKLDGFPAVVAQHEIDHLDGVLICDYGVPVVANQIPNLIGEIT